jgi:hypothetical protein
MKSGKWFFLLKAARKVTYLQVTSREYFSNRITIGKSKEPTKNLNQDLFFIFFQAKSLMLMILRRGTIDSRLNEHSVTQTQIVVVYHNEFWYFQ